jgi:GNAT superfamily N-acetyltransferase
VDQVRFAQAAHDGHLGGILDLQQRNLEEVLDPDEVKRDGFVTLRHDLELLREMNGDEPHIVALDGERVVGYALVMATRFEKRLPLIAPMWVQLRSMQRDGRPLESYRFFVMGQVCVDHDYRGRGVFEGLFARMRECYARRYDFTLTVVARRNGRSIRAHEKVGFALWRRYSDAEGEEWDLIGWDWRDAPG